MSAGVRVAIRLVVTPILVAGLFGLLWIEHHRLQSGPQRMLILPLIVTVVSTAALLEIFRMARIKGLQPAWIVGTSYLVFRLATETISYGYLGATNIPGFVSFMITIARHADILFGVYLLTKLVFARSNFAPQDAGLSYLAPAYVFLLKLTMDLYNRVPIQPPPMPSQPMNEQQLEVWAQQVQQLGFQTRADHFIYLLLFIFIASKIPDMFGYVVGKTMGKHPMAPVLSPAKTWEGGIAGFCGGMIAAAAVLFMTPLRQVLGLHPLLLIVLAALVTISAMVGDLVKSAFKRWAGVKDSGLIPEFGGVLDIIDSFLLSVPTTYLFLSLVPKL